MAAGAAAVMASAREQGDVLGLLPARRADAGRAGRGGRRHRPAGAHLAQRAISAHAPGEALASPRGLQVPAAGASRLRQPLGAIRPTAGPAACRRVAVALLEARRRARLDRRPARHHRDHLEDRWRAARIPRRSWRSTRSPTRPLPQALLRFGTWVADHGIDADGPWRAVRDLLLGRAPRCGQGPGEPLRRPGEEELDAARRLAMNLDGATLAIQGPPGSGKTYTGAQMILRLLADGRRVGISATSHKVIGNFLKAILKAASKAGVEVRAVQKAKPEESDIDDPRLTVIDDNGRVRKALESGDSNLAAGTPWLWGREDFAGLVDVLFVDEAGTDLPRQRGGHGRRDGQPRAPGRPAAARSATPGFAPARCGSLRPGPSSR